MRFYYYKNDNKKEIKKIDRDNIAKDISDKCRTWHEDTQDVRDDYKRIIRDVFPSIVTGQQNKIKLIPDVYEQRQTYISNMFKATYSSYEGMFDVEGQDPEAHNVSAILKASLVYDFERINLKHTLDKILEDWTDKGEACAFIHWKTEVERQRKQQENASIDPITGQPIIEIVNVIEDVVKESRATVRRIDPLNFYFDKSQKEDWCSCGKIIRNFVPLQYILSNKNYKLTPQERKDLKDKVAQNVNKKEDDIEETKYNIDTKFLGSTVEVLEYWGDYIIPDNGDVARNVVITIIAGEYVAQLEESQYPICPIVYGCCYERPDTLRGQTPLKPAILLNELENKCIDLQLKAWRLSVDPVMLAPKGMIPTGQKLVAGRPFEYNYNQFNETTKPEKLDFSSGLRGFDFQEFLKRKMEGATGISPYMQGTGGFGGVRTASEATYIYSGQTTRLARESYTFSERIILPIVKGYFLMKKEFEQGNKLIKFDNSGVKSFAYVDDEVRKRDYQFIIGTAQSTVEHEQYVQKLFQVLQLPTFQAIVARPEFPSLDFFKWVLNEVNFKQIDSLLYALTQQDMIANQGRMMGVQEKNLGEFVGDMRNVMNASIPDMANLLAQQQMNGEIPNATDVREQVQQEDQMMQ